jgi:hypothetical protein
MKWLYVLAVGAVMAMSSYLPYEYIHGALSASSASDHELSEQLAHFARFMLALRWAGVGVVLIGLLNWGIDARRAKAQSVAAGLLLAQLVPPVLVWTLRPGFDKANSLGLDWTFVEYMLGFYFAFWISGVVVSFRTGKRLPLYLLLHMVSPIVVYEVTVLCGI